MKFAIDDWWTRYERLSNWHRWFCWRPVRVDGHKIAWFCTIERRLRPEPSELDIGHMLCGGPWLEYRFVAAPVAMTNEHKSISTLPEPALRTSTTADAEIARLRYLLARVIACDDEPGPVDLPDALSAEIVEALGSR